MTGNERTRRQMVLSELKFDTPKFISEIQKRQIIWNKTGCMKQADEFCAREEQWKEVVELYCSQDASPSTKKDLCQQLKTKWRNIRNSFVKVHKTKMKLDDNEPRLLGRKQDYLYYENLLFLVKTLKQPAVSKHKNEPPFRTDQASDDDDDEDNKALNTWVRESNDFDALCPLIPEIKVETENGICEEDPIGDDNNSCVSWSLRKRNIDKKDTESDSETQDSGGSSKRIKTGDIQLPGNILPADDSVLFFLSLVKEFKKIPEQNQLQTKLDILKRIQDGQNMNGL